jgi:hypothetical protein
MTEGNGYVHTILLTFVLERSAWLAAGSCRSTSQGRNPRYPLDRRVGGCRAVEDSVEKRNCLDRAENGLSLYRVG